MKLFIIQKYKPESGKFEFQGVFDSEQVAVDACITENHCICPATLNERLPEEPTIWPLAYYPLSPLPE